MYKCNYVYYIDNTIVCFNKPYMVQNKHNLC